MQETITYVELWHKRLFNDARRPFLINAGKSFTFIETWREINKLARHLRRLGVRKGYYVALSAENDWQTALLILALPLIGAAAAPINRYYSQTEMGAILADASYSVFIAEKTRGNSLPDGIKFITLKEIFNEDSGSKDLPLTESAQENVVSVVFSSGSSGGAKAVTHSFVNHYYSALGSNENIPFGKGDVWLLSLPLYHIAGLSILFRALLDGAAVRVMRTKERLGEILERESITHISLVEKQLRTLLQKNDLTDRIAGLKALLVGGSAVAPNLIEDAYERGWCIHTSYGSTESASQVTTTPSGSDLTTLKSSGRILRYRELKIDGQGQILLRGKTLSSGYLRNGQIIDICNKEGWYAGGDLGYLDKHGRLWVTGRLDNMFISGGENIYPEVIERAVKSLPGVLDAVIVPVEDKKFGSRPALFLHAQSDELGDINTLRNLLREKLAAYMLPDYLFPWPQVWQKGAVKISRKYFKELAVEMTNGK